MIDHEWWTYLELDDFLDIAKEKLATMDGNYEYIRKEIVKKYYDTRERLQKPDDMFDIKNMTGRLEVLDELIHYMKTLK